MPESTLFISRGLWIWPLKVWVRDELFSDGIFKVTVRPDRICMRVVSLESSLKGHQPLYVFNFYF
jgi:hypothetical protein